MARSVGSNYQGMSHSALEYVHGSFYVSAWINSDLYAHRPWSSSYVSAEAGLLNHCCWQQWSILSVPQHLGVVNFFLVADLVVACVVL